MRTTVNTTKRTTYVVTDHDIIEALAALGIPRSVLLSRDTIIRENEDMRGEQGFYFDGSDDPFLTIEAPAEESEESEESEASVDPTPEPKPDVYPNGTVLIGQYSGVAYTIRGYDHATSTYTVWAEQDRASFQSPRAETHNGRIYRVKPAPAPDRFPIGTILRLNLNGKDYFIVGHVSPPERPAEGYRLWHIDDKREDWEEYPVAHDPATYTVVRRPAPGVLTPGEGAPADPFPVGTVLQYTYNYGGFLACVTGHTKEGDPDKGPGYTMFSPTLISTWDTYDSAHRNYTVLYRPPSKA